MYAQVIDFSIAERNGFVEAYVEHQLRKLINNLSLPENMVKSHKEYLKKEAISLLKGCQEHFRQSVTRISRNHAIVNHESSAQFQSMALRLLKINERDEFDKVIESIQKNWPNTTSWLEWWVYTDAGKILFPVLSSMDENLSKKLPDSINAQESMHHRYYMCGTIHQSIITGIYLKIIVNYC